MVSHYNRVISIWPRPEPNETNVTVNSLYSYYYETAFGNPDGSCGGAPFNLTAEQSIVLKLNDTKPISSFYIQIQPGGLYGGYVNQGTKQNYTLKPLIAEVGKTICRTDRIYDYQPHTAYIFFICDDEQSGGGYSFSSGVDEIVFYVHPNQFAPKFEPKNVSLCSLTLFHTSDNCGIPDKPLNSFVRIENQMAIYSCDEGYELLG